MPDAKNEAIKKLKEGQAPESVASVLGLPRSIVSNIIKEEKIYQSRRISHNQALRIIRYYQDGAMASELATRYGITKTYLYIILERFGVTERQQNHKKKKTK